MLRFTRDHGWDSLWVGQHYLSTPTAMLQPVPFLARLAAEADDMWFGLGVLLIALHSPVHVAETVATLDVITGGRLIFGAGLGYRDVEYAAFGISRAERTRRFEVNLEVCKRLLEGESVSVDQPWCRLDNAVLSVPPVQRPRPSLWVAANGDSAVERAARLGDTWLINPHAPFDTIKRQLDLFRAVRRNGRHDPAEDLPAIKEIFCAEDRAVAAETCDEYLARKYSVYAEWGQDQALPGSDSFGVPFSSLLQDRFIIGNPDDCIEQLRPWCDELQISHLIFRTHWSGMPVELSLNSLRLLTSYVIPALKES